MKYTTADRREDASNMSISNDSNHNGCSFNKIRNFPMAFSEQVSTVTSLFEGWNDCERTVVMYALLKRLRYPSLKFLQYSIDHTLTQNSCSESNLSSVIVDINANNASYLQNLLNAYKTLHLNDVVNALPSGSLDKDSATCYGSDFQITNGDESKLYTEKKDILHEMLNMLPLLKPGNDDAKLAYLALIPAAVKDTLSQRVPTELVQQIFSYMLIHPAISSDDRRSLNVWLRHLEDHLQGVEKSTEPKVSISCGLNPRKIGISDVSVSSVSSLTSSMSNNSVSSSVGSLALGHGVPTYTALRSADWQTIAPPNKPHHHIHQHPLQQPKSLPDWSSFMSKGTKFSSTAISNVRGASTINNGSGCNRRNSIIVDQLCDNFNGINLNELGSSQSNLGLSLSIASIGGDTHADEASLVNGVAAAAVSTVVGGPGLFCCKNNPIINISDGNSCVNSGDNNSNSDEHDTSFSKNGTEILDFEPHLAVNVSGECNNNSLTTLSQSQSGNSSKHQKPPTAYTSMLLSNYDPIDSTRWSLDGKLIALKTRRSNSLTTQAISTSSSSSNSSVITVNGNCSNSTENLAQFANKPRSFSLSIEHQRGVLTNSGSDTRLDDFKPGYIKFQTSNVGMSNIGLWLKSLRLHKYIDLFKNMTYEDMLCITEEYLQGLGVTKGASHKLALCIEKLKERKNHLCKLEQELLSGQLNMQTAVEDLANMVLSPMKPVEIVNTCVNEDNVSLRFLKVVDLVGSMIQQDTCTPQDEENINVLMWVLDRSIHNEAFMNHSTQLKELKFKLSKLKMSIGHKVHHVKNGNAVNLSKPRWNGKSRKCDVKNGSNDRINHRKNSNDILHFSQNCILQPQQQHQHSNHTQQAGDYEKYKHIMNGNGGNSNTNTGSSQHQYKSSSYPNFISNQHQQGKQQHHIHHSQSSQQQSLLPQHTHFSTLSAQQQQQHRRSLNNLIVVSGGPQQPQKMVFKPGQGILPAVSSSTDSQPHRTSLTTGISSQSNNNVNLATTFSSPGVGNSMGNTDSTQQSLRESQSQQINKTMTAVVMGNLSNFEDHFTLF